MTAIERQASSIDTVTRPGAGDTLLLRAEGLALARADALIIEDLDLELHKGESLHVRGPNGAGKSTLLEALAGLHIPAAGSVERLTQAPAGYLGHLNGLLPDLTTGENLQLFAGCGLPADSRPMERLELHSFLDKPIRSLSQGQARRVALALACRPDQALWLLDEPFAGLDQATVDSLADLFTTHLQQGGGLVFSSHDRSLPGARVLQLRPAVDQHQQGEHSAAAERSEADRRV